MQPNRLALGAMLSFALAVPAGAQVHQVAFDWDASQGGHDRLDTCVAASPDRIVVATNHQFSILTRSGVEEDRKKLGETGFPFPSALHDPRVDYDPYSGRLWMVMVEFQGKVGVAVSKDSSPDSFGSADWHIYTGSTAFDLTQIGSGTPYLGGADHPAISFDSHYMYLTSVDGYFDPMGFPAERQSIAVFPKTHGSGKSILSGDPMTAADLHGVSPEDPPDPLVADDLSEHHFPIQELFEDVEEGQFFVSFPAEEKPWRGHFNAIRVGGAWFDATGELQYQSKDITLAAPNDYFGVGTSGHWPDTPKLDWHIVSAVSKFDSGVLARDSTDDAPLKIFTGHHVLVSDGGVVDQTEFRWYVIDPDLGNFPGANWAPTIEVVGRAPAGSISNGETYQGAIAVNETGAAYITFTRSGDSGSGAWPSLIRASLALNYTTVLAELNTVSQAGPAFWYDEGSGPVGNLGSDYTDIQADYLHCGFWATGALVTPNENTPPAASDIRETWVTEISITCNNAEMNGDGVVDETDLALYLEYHATGDQRADMDRSGTVTTADYQKYSDEYAKR